MFVVVGLVGAVLLVVFLVLDDVLEGILPDADWISGPALGAFLAAFGLFGWVGQEAFDAVDAGGRGGRRRWRRGARLVHLQALQGAAPRPDRRHADARRRSSASRRVS